MSHKTISLIGYASGLGAGDPLCAQGPVVLKQSTYLQDLAAQGLVLQWQKMIQPAGNASKMESIAQECKELADMTAQLTKEKKCFLVTGGDHSAAVGTWSGVAHAINPVGLIWVDAHMDSHTPETSLSGNIHGMPLASLLGQGDARLTKILNDAPKIKPEHVCLIGVRSYEKAELDLLTRLKVKIFFMKEVQQRGLAAVFADAIKIVTQGTKGFGVTIDIDGIDPKDAPATGVAEPDGIRAHDLCEVLTTLAEKPNLLGVEIAEFDPHRDREQMTEKLIAKLISAFTLGRVSQ